MQHQHGDMQPRLKWKGSKWYGANLILIYHNDSETEIETNEKLGTFKKLDGNENERIFFHNERSEKSQNQNKK